jgi:hypothetical protein
VFASFGEYTPDFDPTPGVPVPAQFLFQDWRCDCVAIGACLGGSRTNISTCPTNDGYGYNAVNLAGCTGKVTVRALDGEPLREDDPEDSESCLGSDGCAIRYGEGLAALTTTELCATDEGAPFPGGEIGGLGAGQMVRVTQACTVSPPSVQENERFVDVDVLAMGSSAKFEQTHFAVVTGGTTCKPAEIDPTECPNEGGLWIIATLESTDTCEPANFKCGGAAGGPQPDRCKVNKGKCECRCDRCDDVGTLANIYSANQGAYVISSSSSGNAYECPLKLLE